MVQPEPSRTSRSLSPTCWQDTMTLTLPWVDRSTTRSNLEVDSSSSMWSDEGFLARVFNASRSATSEVATNVSNPGPLIGWDESGGTYDDVPPGPVAPRDRLGLLGSSASCSTARLSSTRNQCRRGLNRVRRTTRSTATCHSSPRCGARGGIPTTHRPSQGLAGSCSRGVVRKNLAPERPSSVRRLPEAGCGVLNIRNRDRAGWRPRTTPGAHQ
jgi:hypothetical protein